MGIVDWEKDGTVAIMTMNNGENRQNPEWAEAMFSTYSEIIADEGIKALVLTSSDSKNFCLGIDVQWLMNKISEQDYTSISDWLYRNNEVFKALLTAPIPTIAAITGHAFGNGAVLAGACDFRFMRADRGYFCFPEVDMGIQFTPSMIEWMKRIMPYPLFTRMLFTGEKVNASELQENGVILKSCEDAGMTLDSAIAFGKTFNKSRITMGEMKQRTNSHILHEMAHRDPRYIDYIPEQVNEGKQPIFMMTPG